jgi:hypothetical protein
MMRKQQILFVYKGNEKYSAAAAAAFNRLVGRHGRRAAVHRRHAGRAGSSYGVAAQAKNHQRHQRDLSQYEPGRNRTIPAQPSHCSKETAIPRHRMARAVVARQLPKVAGLRCLGPTSTRNRNSAFESQIHAN